MLVLAACADEAAPGDAGNGEIGARADTLGDPTAGVAEPPVTGPAGGATAPSDATSVDAAAGQDSTRNRKIEAARAPVPTPATLLDSAAVDLDGDGESERLLLYAAVDRDDRGRLMWDDGQRWLLLARDDEREYVLFDGFVQLGRLGFHVIERGDGRTPLLVLQEQAGAGLRIWSYGWDVAGNAFRGSLVLEATGNVVHATPPLGGV